MIVRLAVAVLALAMCLGGFYAALATGPAAQAAGGYGAPSTEYRTDFIATPIVRQASIDGYIIGRYVFSLDPAAAEALGDALPAAIVHGVNDFFYRNGPETFWKGGSIEIADVADGIKAAIDRAAARKLVVDMSIRQIDYLRNAELRQPVISVER